MSNDRHVLTLRRRLADVRIRPEQGGETRPSPTPGPSDSQAAELQQREAALAEREQQLAAQEAALAQERQALGAKSTRLADLIGSVSREKAAMLAENEGEIVSLTLSITEKVLQYEIENGRYKIGEIVKSALQAVRDRGEVVIRVNPDDHAFASEAVAALGPNSGKGHLSVIADDSVPLASCCIDTDSGRVFSEIPRRLKMIEESLLRKNGDSDGL